MGGFGAGSGWQFMKTRGFLTRGFAISKFKSGKKKEPKPKVFDPDIFGWGGGLPREGVGPKSSVRPSKPETKLFWRGIPGFLPGYPPEVAEKFEEKKVCVHV